jgi:hypothetical protein
MIERHLHFLRVEQPAATETVDEARDRLAAKFPRGALRRMTHLGLLVGSALDGLAIGLDDTVVYATTYAETRALEDYLTSFPDASPLLFQTSIHPSAVQQVLIGRQQPVRRFFPLTGRRRLVEQALLTALIDPARQVVLLGGEERGTWMLDHGMASDRAFAFALSLRAEPAGAIGRVAFAPDGADQETGPCPTLPDFVEALAGRHEMRWRGASGGFTLQWS